jgi:hypothetical protein
MNEAQRAVAAFSEFQGQVQNGGISQYIFNCSEQLKYLLDALPLMEWRELETQVRGALSALDSDMIADLGSTHEIWDNEEAEFADRWAAFRAWVDAFDGDDFDEWFYDHYDEYVRCLMSLIWRRRAELITGANAKR